MKKYTGFLIAVCVALAAEAADKEAPDDLRSETRRKQAAQFLVILGMGIGEPQLSTLREVAHTRSGDQRHRQYRFDLSSDSRLTLDETGRVREFFGDLEGSSNSRADPGLLSDRLLGAVLPNDVVVDRPTISRDGARAVHYTFQRTIKGVPVEGQRVRMAFDTETGRLLFLRNTLDDARAITMDLPPAIGYPQAVEKAKATVLQDLQTLRWKGIVDPREVTLVVPKHPRGEGKGNPETSNLVITLPNTRFDSNSAETPVANEERDAVLAYDILVEIRAKPSAQRPAATRLADRVWVDAHTGEVIGGE
jgi:hypothetical protein